MNMAKKYAIIAQDFNSPVVRNEIFVNAVSNLWPRLFKLPGVPAALYFENNHMLYTFQLKYWQKAKETFQKRIAKRPDELSRVIELSHEWANILNTFTEKSLKTDLKTLSGAKLCKLYARFYDLQSREYGVGVILPLIDNSGISFLEKFLQDYLAKHPKAKDKQKLFKLFTAPTKNSFALDQEEALLRLYENIYGDKKLREIFKKNEAGRVFQILEDKYPRLARALNNHAKKFGWVYYVYQGPAFGPEEFIEFIKDFISKKLDPAQELTKRREELKQTKEEQEKWLKILKPSEADEKLIRLTGEFVWAKPRRKDYQSKSYFHMEKFYKEFARRFDLILPQARAATLAQIKRALLKSQVDRVALNQQARENVVYSEKGKIKILADLAARNFRKIYIAEEAAEKYKTGELRGSMAFMGRAKGHVKIVNAPEDMPKMKKGDILVSVATTPSIVMAMKKAAAIVTEEGGLTCHASIVSRELKIPCVVGTKVATKIFKDGDLVEVDANRGIIKKI